MDQVLITITGAIAIWLTQQNKHEDWKKYACVFGLLGQPFWLYATYTTAQWGIFVLTIFYTYVWILGFYNHWIKEGET